MTLSKAKEGDTVKIHYTGKREDETVFGTSKDGHPIEFVIGDGAVISGLEEGVVGMEAGQSKTITVPPEEAFGHVRGELITTVEKDHLPDNLTPVVGQVLQMKYPDGKTTRVNVTDVKDDTITLDANHPLAGETLSLDVELVEIMQ
jgi:FKBP-type peptidyl-prolyl cis-trans isomerase 2